MSEPGIRDGVEFFSIGCGEYDVQCARCGSSVGSDEHDEDGRAIYCCLSGEAYCQAHPMPGRESERGAR